MTRALLEIVGAQLRAPSMTLIVAPIVRAGDEARFIRELPAAQPVTFPRASAEQAIEYLGLYAQDCRPLMRAWVVQTFSPFGEFTLPFGALNLTAEEVERDALVIAERAATSEIRRECNANERRLLAEVTRDLMCAAVVMRDAKREREHMGEVL